MIGLDRLSRDILMILLRSSGPKASKDIASLLDITKRMVRYRQDLIQKWLEIREADLIVRPNYGIEIQASKEQKQTLIQELENTSGYSLILSKEERAQLLIFALLLDDSPLTSTDLVDELGISRTTLYKDLDEVERWFLDHHIRVKRKPGVGICLEAEEFQRRILLEEFILEVLGEPVFLDVCFDVHDSLKTELRGRIELLRKICALFDKLAVKDAQQIVKDIEHELGYQFTDNAYSSLVFQVALLFMLSSEGRTVAFGKETSQEIKFHSAYPIAAKALSGLESLLSLEEWENEKIYLTIQILCSQQRYTVSSIMGEEGPLGTIPEVSEIVESILETASIYLHPSLREDRELRSALSYHLKTTLFRLKYELPIRNPILEDVRKRYPYIYKVAQMASIYLSSKTSKIIPEEEIGKITVHLAAGMEKLRAQHVVQKKVIVVCGEGISTAWLVISRLNAVFPEIEVIEIMSKLEVSKCLVFPGDMDGMISTIPLKIPGIPIVQVTPMLDEGDQEKIKKTLQLIQANDVFIKGNARMLSLSSVIKPERIRLNVQASDWRDVVLKTGRLLLKRGAVEEKYIQAMESVIEKHGPYVVVFPGVALLHARPEQGVNQFSMSLITLKEPVSFGHPDHDPVDISISLAAVDEVSHIKALLELIETLRDERTLQRIRKAKRVGEVMEAFKITMEANKAGKIQA